MSFKPRTFSIRRLIKMIPRRQFSLLLILVTALVATSYSQPELDGTFNATGRQTTPGGYANGMMVQPDKKIVLFGRHSDGSGSFGAIRYNEDGSLDNSFGNGGIVATDFDPILNDAAFGGVLQSDGKIVLAGVTSLNAINLGNFALVRYNSDGSLDNSFGNTGKVVSNFESSGEDLAKSVTIQPDGKIIAVGRTFGTSPGSQIVVRYDSSGTLDPTFGNAGIIKTVVSGHSIWGESVALQPDGKVLVGGGKQTIPAPPNATFSFTLTRYTSNGTLDGSFGGNGIVSVVYGFGGDSNTNIRSIAVQQDGRIVAAGWDSVIFRFNVNGSPDTSFDGDGTLRPVLNGGEPKSLVLNAGGKITVAGRRSNDFAISRYNSDGSLDTTFSEDGHLLVDIDGGSSDIAASVAVDALRRIVVGGSSDSRYAAIRLRAFLTAANVSGRVTRSNGRPVLNATLYMDNGKGSVLVARTNPFGYYRYIGAPTGVYTISTVSKSFTFAPRTINVFDNLTNIDFVADP